MDKSQLYKVPLKYGLAGGFISVVLFVTLYFMGEDPLSSLRKFDFVLIPLFIYFSLKELRDYKYGGKMLYWQGMTTGFVCYFLIALISASAIWLFLSSVDPDLFVRHKQENIAILTNEPEKWADQVGKKEYEEALRSVKAITPFSLAADDFIKKALTGLFVTSFIAIFFKRT
jgi:hypothetical protein